MTILYKSRVRHAAHMDGLSAHQYSKSDDPHMEFALPPQKKGWYKVDVKVNCPLPYFNCKFYTDFGRGYNEVDNFLIFMEKGLWSRELVYFGEEIKNLRFDPLDASIDLHIEHISMTKLSLVKLLGHSLKKNFKFYAKKFSKKPKEIETCDKPVRLLSLISPSSNTQFSLTEKQAPKNISAKYHQWIHFNEQGQPYTEQIAEGIMRSLSYEPLMSVVMPVYNVASTYLDQAIQSVVDQQYPNWELCISDDCSSDVDTIECLKKWEKKDDRIKVHYREENGHISANSNSALELVTGSYCVLMDHDDLLRPHSVLELVIEINKKPEVLFVYSDEDKIDENNFRSDPHFKSGWNPDLFFAQNYLNHLTCLQTERLKEIGGWRIGYEGSQDYDLYLRFLYDLNFDKVSHIPKVLYHWRAIEGSTALALGEKSYAVERGIKAANDFFQEKDSRIKVDEIEGVPHYRVHWPVPNPEPLVSIIIPTKDYAETLKVCIDSVREKTTYSNYEIIVVDNNSEKKETQAYFKEISKAKDTQVILFDGPFNYSAINNYAVKQAKGEYLVLMNNDIEIISEDWVEQMLCHASRKEIGCVGAKLYYPDDTLQHASIVLGIGGVAGHSHKGMHKNHIGYFAKLKIPHSVSGVTAAMLMVSKDIFEKVGGLNEKDLKVAFNDVDFCMKVLAAGYRNFWTPYAEAYHYESKSRGYEDNPEKVARFKKEEKYMKATWGSALANDHFYPANLTKKRQDFSYD